jgi:hypothetical protein
MTKANATTLITNHNQSGKTKTAATLHNFCDTVDMDQTVDKFAIALFAIIPVFVSCHGVSPLNQLRS